MRFPNTFPHPDSTLRDVSPEHARRAYSPWKEPPPFTVVVFLFQLFRTLSLAPNGIGSSNSYNLCGSAVRYFPLLGEKAARHYS